MTPSVIREDLKNIRYYYSREALFDKVIDKVGKNMILEKIKKYNSAICSASPKLYDLYVSLYLQNNTQDSLSEKMGYSIEHISRLNSQLIKFFEEKLSKDKK